MGFFIAIAKIFLFAFYAKQIHFTVVSYSYHIRILFETENIFSRRYGANKIRLLYDEEARANCVELGCWSSRRADFSSIERSLLIFSKLGYEQAVENF